MDKIILEDKISSLRDKRVRNGWNNKEATDHESLMKKLISKFPNYKYLKT